MNLNPLLRLVLILICFFYLSNIWSQKNVPKPINVIIDGPYTTQCFTDYPEKLQSLNVALFEPNSLFEVSKHHKLEIGIALPEQAIYDIHRFIQQKDTNGLNPYNPKDIDCSVQFISPSGETQNSFGFYYTPQKRNLSQNSWNKDTTSYPFRIRFAPNEIGSWCGWITLKLRVGNEYISLTKNISFNCIDSDHRGKLITNDGQLYFQESNAPFVHIGHTIAHSDYYHLTPESSERHIKWIEETGKAGANYLRLELSGRNGLPDFDDTKNYESRQEEMWEFDKYVETAAKNDMYFTIFRHHIEVLDEADWDVVKWGNNSYRKDFGLTTRYEYFTDSNVIVQQQNTLRYIFARWGYTPNFALYGYSEVNNWYKPLIESENFTEKESEEIFAGWLKSQFDYIKDKTNWAGTGFVCGYTGSYPTDKLKSSKVMPICDVVGIHHYGGAKHTNFLHRYDYTQRTKIIFPNKPVQIQEIGLIDLDIYCCTDVNFHNTIWSTSFMGLTGPGAHWWWDRGINDNKYYMQYGALKNFIDKHLLTYSECHTPQKWTNSAFNNMYKSSIENYTITNDDATIGLGWVHNSAAYWRNAPKDSVCMNDLVIDGKLNQQNKCHLDDGVVMGNGTDADFEKDEDYFTDHPSELNDAFYGKNFTISNLQNNLNQIYNPWAKEHWYKIEFYNTRGSDFNMPLSSVVSSTNALGKISIPIPTYQTDYQDFVYVLTYLGKSKKPLLEE